MLCSAPLERAPVILVTGATGFLGGAVACEMLAREPRACCLFLVRSERARNGAESLRRNLARFDPRAATRLTEDSILCGDLESFSAMLEDERVKRVTHVVNCAALVSFAWRRDVWITNVDHTSAFAEAVARLQRLQRFLHVGTALISGSTTDRNVHEHEFPGNARQFTLYTKSKAEIERRLPAVLGPRLVIARPSVIVGHTRVGCEASASIFWLFRMIHAAKRVPFSPRRRIDVVPVDYCACAIVQLLFKTQLAHTCYHVSAGPAGSCSFEDIDRAYGRARGEGEPAQLREFDIDALPLMEREFESWFGRCDTRRAAGAIRIYHAFAGLNVTFENARLLGEGVAPALSFCDYLPACVRTGERESIAEQMRRDFR